MTPTRPRAPLDWLVLTAANRRQAKAYAAQLTARAEHSALSNAAGVLIVPDACDARIGSGAATVLALVQVARQLLERRGPKSPPRGFATLFEDVRVLMLHSGGDARRLPMYAAEGKLFASLPRRGAGARCATVFDLLLDDFATLEPRAGGEVLVGAGDAVLGLARESVRFEGDGVIGVAQRADLARAMRHGVFVCAKKKGSEEVAAFLQKPSAEELRAAGAIARDGLALVDTGLLSFDPPSIERLLKGCGVQLQRDGTITLRAGGLADLASRAELPSIDLYREVLMALPRSTTRAEYLASCAAGVLAKPLGAYFDAMHGARFTVKEAQGRAFLHIGSTRDMLESLVGKSASGRAFGVGVDWNSHGMLGAAEGKGELVVLGGVVGQAQVDSLRAIVDRVSIPALKLGGNNLVVGVAIANDAVVALPRGVSLFSVPVHESGEIIVACGLDDDFKSPLRQGGTLLDKPFAAFCTKAGLNAESLLEADGSLWDARLWCEAPSADPLALVRWMWEGTPAPQAWKDQPRYTMREVMERADLGAILSMREEQAVARIAARPMASLAEAIDSADARSIHSILVHLDEAHRLPALRNGAMELLALEKPIERAHGAATLAEMTGLSTPHGAALRNAAFQAVGEAVLSRFELPTSARRAVILPDQAVWTSMPVRVDLAGGWSDTPPICNAVGGAVVNVAVKLRGQLPIQVVAKLEEEPFLRITSTDSGQTREIRSMEDLAQRSDPTRWSSLAESALVLAGIAPSDPKASLSKWLEKLGGGLSLTLFSAVPKGSGLGTSSILGAATIHALDRALGRERSPQELFAAVSALEQMLSSRGGWQDQVGGVLGGFKIARTEPGATQTPVVESIVVPANFAREFSARSLLYFTGERRMAKNILENVVWSWLVREPKACRAVERLKKNAERMRDALTRGDFDATQAELSEYMKRKRELDPGSCPKAFDDLTVRWKRELATSCFAGAGGGGFMLLVAKDAMAAESLRSKIERDPPHPRARAFDFEIDTVGLRCAVL